MPTGQKRCRLTLLLTLAAASRLTPLRSSAGAQMFFGVLLGVRVEEGVGEPVRVPVLLGTAEPEELLQELPLLLLLPVGEPWPPLALPEGLLEAALLPLSVAPGPEGVGCRGLLLAQLLLLRCWLLLEEAEEEPGCPSSAPPPLPPPPPLLLPEAL
jgi:hypothetical protein